MADAYHVPVMADETLAYLALEPGQTVVDATLGGGGHAALMAQRLGPTGLLIGIDQDPEAIYAATQSLAPLPDGPRFATAHTRFDFLEESLARLGVSKIDAILFDLGVSSHQLDEPKRGFSFKDPAMPLDMRMNSAEVGLTAADLLNTLDERALTKIFRDYADERWAARIAQFVAARRIDKPYAQVGDLVDTVRAAVPAAARAQDIHPATRVFQALRIAVNDEFGALERALAQSVQVLAEGGRIVVISYHSGEDRIVKQFFAQAAGQCVCPRAQPVCTCGASRPSLALAFRKPLGPGDAEIARNPRARSAKMRVARKI